MYDLNQARALLLSTNATTQITEELLEEYSCSSF